MLFLTRMINSLEAVPPHAMKILIIAREAHEVSRLRDVALRGAVDCSLKILVLIINEPQSTNYF